MSQNALISPIREWLIDSSLGSSDIVEMFQTMCMRISAVGIPVTRARLIWPTLHPLFQAETVIWDKGESARLEQFEHQDQNSDAWNRSPLKYVIDHNLDLMRRKLVGPEALLDFTLFEELKEQGYTDFLLLATALEGMSTRKREGGNNRGILVSWASDKPEGFTGEDLISLQKIQRRFAVACKTIIQARISDNIAKTYLGVRAGENVLNGQIRRGDGERTNAVVWYADMRNSTSLADTMEPDEYFDLLNAYFMSTAEPVVNHGGEILDFIGDAVLGIFPYQETSQLSEAAKAANAALDDVLDISREANKEREKQGLEMFKFGIGLNVGEVMFGNIGIPSRLTFSVIGPTVNEVARIESMTKLLQTQILADQTFASLNPDRWQSVGEHKLDGVLFEKELFSFKCAA